MPLHSKGNYQQNKKTNTEWEKLFANDITDKGLISTIQKLLIKLNNNKQTNQKVDKIPK